MHQALLQLKKYPLFLLTLLLLCFSLPDVIFGGASLMIGDHFPMDGTPAKTVSLFPESTEMINQGFFDIGGTLWQSESKIPYMEYVLKEGKSIYWNPYIGAGSLGPETLVDIKLSPLTIISGLLGSSSAAVTFTTLTFLGLGMFCIMSLMVNLLHLPIAAGIAAALAYAFNGFNTSGLGANYTQVYLLFPIYLYALCWCLKAPSILRFILACAAAALILCITFMPTTTLTLLSCSAIAFGYALSLRGDGGTTWKRILLIGCVPAMALLLLAFIYIPIAQALMATPDLDAYNERRFFHATINAILSVFTPKHFWNSYVTMDAFLYEPSNPAFTGNVVFHIGLIGGLFALFSCSRKGLKNPVLLCAWIAAALTLMRIFAVPFYSDFVDKLPLLSSFGEQYVWNGFMVCVPVLVGYGAARFLKFPKQSSVFTLLFVVFIIGCVLYLRTVFPTIELNWEKFMNLTWLAFMLLAIAAIGYATHRQWLSISLPAIVLILMLVEYSFYMNHWRPIANNQYITPPPYVTYLKQHLDQERILNIGSTGIPAEEAGAFQIHDLSQLTMNMAPGYEKFYNDYLLPKSYKFGLFLTFLQAKDVPELPINIASFMGVRYIIVPSYWVEWPKFLTANHMSQVYTDQRISIYENPKVWPRAFLLANNKKPLLIENIQQDRITAKDVQEVDFDETDHTRTIMQVNALTDSQLVLTDSWNPHWKASIDGTPVEIEKLFGAFRMITVPKGTHHVTFYYDNPAIAIGKKISMIGVTMLALLGLFAGYRHWKILHR